MSRVAPAVLLSTALLAAFASRTDAQTGATDTRITALVGLARTSRDQGRFDASAAAFRDADRVRPLGGALLVEYFWSAHRAGAADAMEVGQRVLAANPRESHVRDGLIGLAAAARDEARVVQLAEEGRLLEPASALWWRRLAESHLRSGRPLLAADGFSAASGLTGGEAADRAQRALALELAGDKPRAILAWSEVPEAIWSGRSDWVQSRARAFAPAPAPPVRRAAAPAPTPEQTAAAQHATLERMPCAAEPLAALDRLADGRWLIAAVAARPMQCVDRVKWISRAAERAIAAGAFEQALSLVRPVATPGSPAAVREQLGVLLHWTGARADAAPVLEAVVAEDPGRVRATTALIEVRRALGDSEGAWVVAERVWSSSAEASNLLGLAELALETGRLNQALASARALKGNDTLNARVAAIEGRALLALGRPAEARVVLEPLVPEPGASLAWLDAIAASEGLSAAVAAAAQLPAVANESWADVNARRAVWQAQLGHRASAERLLADVAAVDVARARMATAEIALARGRPADAEIELRRVHAERPHDLRALDGLSTTLAEQGRWDEAFATLSLIRARRPAEARWAIREAEWRHRQAPTVDRLSSLEAIVQAHPHADGPSALSRAYFRSGQFDRAIRQLGSPRGLGEHDVVLLARSLRAAGRPVEALAAIQGLAAPTVEALLLRAELDAAVNGPAAANAVFVELTRREDADPDWYVAWADLMTDGRDVLRVLEQASTRYPQHAVIQERLAVAAWTARDRRLAAKAATLALTADDGRPAAWFVQIELTATEGPRDSLTTILDRFEARFPPDSSARIGMAEMIAGLTRSSDDPAALRALEWMELLTARDPAVAPAIVARARLLASLGRLPDALSAIDQLVSARPELPAALKLKAELLAASGRYADAVSAYDVYLAVAPADLAARRQQARVDGWRGAYRASLDRYEDIIERDPQARAVAAEAAAKRAYYSGRWDEALIRYDQWLALEPDDVEARLERAQLEDRLGDPERAAEALRAVAARVAPSAVALSAADRIEHRRRASLDFFATGQSANAVTRRQLLDLLDTGAALSDNLGLGLGTRARVFGGPSFADVGEQVWRGHHVGAQISTALAAPLRASGSLAFRHLDRAGDQWFGDAGLAWRARSSLRLTAAVERSLLLENGVTLAEGISGVGPMASVQWTPNTDFVLQAGATRSALSDGNLRHTFRLSASERVRRGTHELRVLASSEFLSYAQARASYFTPSAFWRHDAGAEWRGWLAAPRFFGDRERWISATYLLGLDDRGEWYHTGRAGVSYELSNGVSLVADGLLVRSRVFDGGRFSVGLRLTNVTLPQP
jgi:tetratricopeptide (TPR) repeat protein